MITSSTSQRSVMVLPSRLETVLERVYSKHKCPPINEESRQRLCSIPEELAFDLLRKAFNSPGISNLDRFIASKLTVTVTSSPAKSPPRSRVSQEEVSVDPEAPSLRIQGNGGSLHIPPQLLALSELEFNKAFLLLTYIPGKDVGEVKITAEEIRGWKDLPMVAYEAAVWDRLGKDYCSPTDRRLSLEWDSAKTGYYQCHVASDGSYTFKGPLLEPTGTHLHKVLGDDNVLTVKFEDVPRNSSTDRYTTYRRIAKNGIMLGLRRYQFFVFKDGGKEEKKKDFSTKGVKCYFIRTDSTSANDMGTPYIFSGKSVYEARMHFMHVHTLPSLANYMARFSLILSKTKKLEVDMTGITFEKIDDIHCHDQNNNDVLDKNGKPCIHSDGTGYISEDLARMCPVNVVRGKCLRSDKVQEVCAHDPPLLIQFRMFYDGYAVKGTFLLNKKLPPRTVQVRPSMIKVSKDPALSNFSTFDSLEVVTTSNPPKRTKLSRNLVALLSYGGIPDEFFLDTLLNTLEETKTIFNNKRAALKAALHYGDMDDHNAAQMILVGIPLDEPHLQDQLFTFSKTEKKDLKAGKLPVSESYYLMGTVDPTGLLKEDEVCVILESGQISGDVLVYRNPGLHFGDIHVLKATYVKALEEYVGNSKYGVFFPQKGPRSLGDEIAGGDFDGDLYFISRNPELLEHFKPSKPWVSLTPPTKGNSARKPSHLSPKELEEELFDMFLKARFHASNVIGMAADSWLAIMDRFLILGDESAEEKAEMKKKMLKLTDIYYDALDAPKKGAKVSLPEELKPDIFPHYMERDQKFKSTSILGMIYDFVKSQTAEEHRPSSEISKLSCFKDEPVSDLYKEKCGQLYKKYRKEMFQALRDKDESASEVIQRHKQEKDESASEVIERYKQEFYGAAGYEDSKKSLKELYLQALALYNIVYDYAIEKEKVGYCGFVWKVAGPVLCRFYLEKTQGKSLVCSPAVVKELWG
ncbi:hypothetical protein Bca101_058239 [Brassica carinata]